MKGLPLKVRELLNKARESALLAVEVYNKPTATFRSGAFIVLMIIAWGALLQAVFHKKHISYYERKGKRRYTKVDGEKKAWGIDQLTREYFKSETDPVRKNLEFLVLLRNKIEHRSYPQLDEEIFGECQASLMNFEEILIKEFPNELQLKQNLIFAMQFSRMTVPEQQAALKRKISPDLATLRKRIANYRSAIAPEQWNSLKYSYRLYLIPKVGNNLGPNDVAVEFVKYDASKPEEMKRLEQLGVIVKEKIVEKERLIPSQDIYKFKPKAVVTAVESALGKSFTTNMHTNAWKYYQARPKIYSGVSEFRTDWCIFDQVHKDFIYTQAWIDFLKTKLVNETEYNRVRNYEDPTAKK